MARRTMSRARIMQRMSRSNGQNERNYWNRRFSETFTPEERERMRSMRAGSAVGNRRQGSSVRNTARYSGITREQQQRRNQTAAARRANNYFRTAADSGRGQSYAKAQPTNAQARSQSYRNVRAAFGLSVS